MTDKEIYGFYEELYNKVKAQNEKEKVKPLTICPAIKGEEYKEGGLMFVGRAINGWCPLSESIRVEEGIEDRIKRCEKCTLDWVVGKNTWSHCIESNCPYAKHKEILLTDVAKTHRFGKWLNLFAKKKALRKIGIKKSFGRTYIKRPMKTEEIQAGFMGSK